MIFRTISLFDIEKIFINNIQISFISIKIKHYYH